MKNTIIAIVALSCLSAFAERVQLLTSSQTNTWEVGSHSGFLTSAPPQSVSSVNGMTGAVLIVETDPVAQAAMATQRIDRIQTGDGMQWIDATGGVWQVSWQTVHRWLYSDSDGHHSVPMPELPYPLPPNFTASPVEGVTIICLTDETYTYYTSFQLPDETLWCTIDPYTGGLVEGNKYAYIVTNTFSAVVTQHVDSVVLASGISTNGLVSTNALVAAIDPLASTNAPVLQNPTLNGTLMFNGTPYTNLPAGGAYGAITNGQGGVFVTNANPYFKADIARSTRWGVDITGNPWDADGHNNDQDRAIVRIAATNTTWIGTQYALYVEGYSYMNGFRISGEGPERNLYKLSEIGFGSPVAMRFATDTQTLPELRITPGTVTVNGALVITNLVAYDFHTSAFRNVILSNGVFVVQ